MHDHSLGGYLRRRSDEELEEMLTYCLREENYANYSYAILEILRVLQERFIPDAAPDEILQIKEKLLQDKPEEKGENSLTMA